MINGTDLANGIDLGWKWGNIGDSGKLAPIKQNSSLFGGYRRPRPDFSNGIDAAEEMDVDSSFERRDSSTSTIRSPSHPEIIAGSLGYIQGIKQKEPSPPLVTTQR